MNPFRPVYHGYLADPFVWRTGEIYYAIGTGPIEGTPASTTGMKPHQGMAFPLLRSHDLVTWECLGGALKVPPWAIAGDFWAPEVIAGPMGFLLYYSVATEGLKHELRVAHSTQPEGPYSDVGFLMHPRFRCPFAIDPHPVFDDGKWYLFYARDFLDCSANERPGTALVVDELLDMTRLAGHEQTVWRADCDWQRFQAERLMYGQLLDWHTLEGPFVRKQGGKYFCFYSGGCFENDTYGVDYVVADSILGPYRATGHEQGPRVLRTLPGKLVGPGHNSIFSDPEGQEYLAFHAWNAEMTMRQMHLCPLVWSEEGPRAEFFPGIKLAKSSEFRL